MSDRFKDIYRIPSARARWWNYNQSGSYFITICTHGMECCLGEIIGHEMYLSEIGRIAEKCWLDIPTHHQYVKLNEWIIMPNHIHGILEIMPTAPVETLHATILHNPCKMNQETLHATSLPAAPENLEVKNNYMASISPRKGSLASIIRSYKSAVSKKVHPLYALFEWQERYYDHVIKDAPTYHRIEAYIKNNVCCWEKDRFFKIPPTNTDRPHR